MNSSQRGPPLQIIVLSGRQWQSQVPGPGLLGPIQQYGVPAPRLPQVGYWAMTASVSRARARAAFQVVNSMLRVVISLLSVRVLNSGSMDVVIPDQQGRVLVEIC